MWRKNSWCLALILITSVLFLGIVSADIRINELELNPEGNDAGYEWLELYSDSEMNLSGYSLKNYDNDEMNLSGIFTGYYIVNFTSQWLDNTDEKVYLMLNGSTVSETDLLEDSFDDIRTWQYCSGGWILANSTPGIGNNCSGNQSQNQTQNYTGNITIELEYDEEITNGEEFEVKVKLSNLKSLEYDVKVYITFEENTTIISETYNDEDDEWVSSTYFISNITSGPGNKTVEFDMRIEDDYENFKGDATIKVKLREAESSNVVLEFEDDIEIKLPVPVDDNIESSSSNQGTLTANVIASSKNESVIRLNSPKETTQDIKTPIYKSKIEYIKEYWIYGFAVICVIVIFILLKDR